MELTLDNHHKNLTRRTMHTIVSWPRPKQWLMIHTSDLMMMIIRESSHILTIITRWVGKLKTKKSRRHQMETFSALLALCVGDSPVPGEFPSQRPVTQNFDVFFDLHRNKRLRRRWLETPSRLSWRHCNVPWILLVMGGLFWIRCCGPLCYMVCSAAITNIDTDHTLNS